MHGRQQVQLLSVTAQQTFGAVAANLWTPLAVIPPIRPGCNPDDQLGTLMGRRCLQSGVGNLSTPRNAVVRSFGAPADLIGNRPASWSRLLFWSCEFPAVGPATCARARSASPVLERVVCVWTRPAVAAAPPRSPATPTTGCWPGSAPTPESSIR